MAVSPWGPGHRPAAQNQEINGQVSPSWVVWVSRSLQEDAGSPMCTERCSQGPGTPALSPSPGLRGQNPESASLRLMGAVRLPAHQPTGLPRVWNPTLRDSFLFGSLHSLLPDRMAAGEAGPNVSGIFVCYSGKRAMLPLTAKQGLRLATG